MPTTIQTLPPAPSRANDTPEQFSNKADALLGALSGFVTAANAQAGENNTAASNAAASAASAGTSQASATASASSATASQTAAAISASAAEAFAQQASGTAISSGTANAVAYLDSNKYLQATSDLTYNGSQLGVPPGTASTPSITTTSDMNTGLYFPAADTVGVAAGGAQVAQFSPSGLGVPAGTVSTPSLTTTGDTNTGLYFPAADTVAIATGGVKRVEVEANGNLLVGTTTAFAKLAVNGSIYAAGGNDIQLGNINNSNAASINSDSNDTSAALVFKTAAAGLARTERARITSDGSLLVGTTSGGSYPSSRLSLSTNTSTVWNVGPYSTSSNFLISQGTGGVVLTGTATSWAALSDARNKTELTPFENAVQKICTLRAGTGRYLKDEETVNRSFLIAQDVLKVLPEAVDVSEDEQQSLMLRYTDLIPLLTAAMQEQQALIESQKSALESLTARITALEAK